ncbi:NACHT and WD domain protein [Aspergillus homomorphus CBS 101889]|uniref:WD40 repeat-like protein n=1 Tax=Aspergillus homomorphus (strain CBS 101889) TaxID=1450537 RepID=A0A395HT01_ASPHC|nr:WD40 repeat-like protein [Aspergillus homomorphus CBS 101889]RAL10543.1 WD40 repeat-like protein [Aspergillus homomorphus CBS 101889]
MENNPKRRKITRPSSGLTTLRKSTDIVCSPYYDYKGSFGLSLLHTVPNPAVDLIFVHGLGGGSRQTWSKTSEPYHHWPQDWLSRDPDFSRARVHSFGYQADWLAWKTSPGRIDSFAQFLLKSIKSNLDICRSNSKIVIISHSMGGLVTKKAYLLARDDPQLREVVSRFHSFHFLATPHNGSDFARPLSRVLNAYFSTQDFMEDLEREAEAAQLINNAFRQFADDFQIWSFYERQTSEIAIYNVPVVNQASATLGSRQERCLLLNRGHKELCHFDHSSDLDYRALRNALADTIDSILAEIPEPLSEAAKKQCVRMMDLTGIAEPPMDDHISLRHMRAPGSCRWLEAKDEYATWKSERPSKPIFWLTGSVGAGKSVLSSSVIDDLTGDTVRCSYFYFNHGNMDRSSAVGCLLSLAFQMSQIDETLRERLTSLPLGAETWELLDVVTIWRKVFLGCIFKDRLPQRHYWVIDALDECRNFPLLVSLLVRAPPELRVFFTSRDIPSAIQCVAAHDTAVEHYHIEEEDIMDDLGILVDRWANRLPASKDGIPPTIRTRILEESRGSFLRTSLMIQKLETARSAEAAEAVSKGVPASTEGFYLAMLQSIPEEHHTLAQAAFKWTVLAMRPLSVDELRRALKADTGETIYGQASSISMISGRLLTVGQDGQVEFIHHTAKTFLLQQKHVKELAINPFASHSRIATLCLQSMIAEFGVKFMDRKFRQSLDPATSPVDITQYAAVHFLDHLLHCAPEDRKAWMALSEFLENHVLIWGEFLARLGKLKHVARIASSLELYMKTGNHQSRLVFVDYEALRSWVHDLRKICARFWTFIHTCPSAMRTLIPSLCPSTSKMAKFHGSPDTGLIIKGLDHKAWSEIVARMNYEAAETSAVALGDLHTSVALSDGTVFLYPRNSPEPKAKFNHGERVNLLRISSDNIYLVASGSQKVRIWELRNLREVRAIDVQDPPLSLVFSPDNTSLVAATEGNDAITWHIQEHPQEPSIWSWTDVFNHDLAEPPDRALLSDDGTFLAVTYGPGPIYLLQVNSDRLVACFCRDTFAGGQHAVAALAFRSGPGYELLIASYTDGELVIYDRWTTEPTYRAAVVFAQHLACSPDGRFLVTGDPQGFIKIFRFTGTQETGLTLIYEVESLVDTMMGIAISRDNLRFADIRTSQCRIWEPEVFISRQLEAVSGSVPSKAVKLFDDNAEWLEGVQGSKITAMCLHSNGRYAFYGTADGSIWYYDIEKAIQREVLFSHPTNSKITCIALCEQASALASADESGQIMIHSYVCKATATKCSPGVFLHGLIHKETVRSMVFNTPGTRLALQGSRSVRVWRMQGADTYVRLELDPTESEGLVLGTHTNPHYFLAANPRRCHVVAWDDRPDLIAEAILAKTNHKKKGSLKKPPPNYFTSVGKRYDESENRQVSTFLAWEIDHLAPPHRDSHEAVQLHGLETVLSNVLQVISVFGNLLVFVDMDFWVCTLDIKRWNQKRTLAWRHFVLPGEWKGSDPYFLIHFVTPRREFVLAKGHEILLMRRGLDCCALMVTWRAPEDNGGAVSLGG